TVTITGYFDSGPYKTQILVGGIAVPFNQMNCPSPIGVVEDGPAYSCTFTLPIASLAGGAEPVTVQIDNGNGYQDITGSVAVTYLAPFVSGLSPASGSTLGGLITVTGKGLYDGEGVIFGNKSATLYECSGNTICEINTPPESAGAVQVYIETCDTVDCQFGTSQPPTYTYQYLPDVTSISMTDNVSVLAPGATYDGQATLNEAVLVNTLVTLGGVNTVPMPIKFDAGTKTSSFRFVVSSAPSSSTVTLSAKLDGPGASSPPYTVGITGGGQTFSLELSDGATGTSDFMSTDGGTATVYLATPAKSASVCTLTVSGPLTVKPNPSLLAGGNEIVYAVRAGLRLGPPAEGTLTATCQGKSTTVPFTVSSGKVLNPPPCKGDCP
ncbi:MAG TPA: IPT/TIG domain-containing protein, partial [Polyangiaceae bacterium]